MGIVNWSIEETRLLIEDGKIILSQGFKPWFAECDEVLKEVAWDELKDLQERVLKLKEILRKNLKDLTFEEDQFLWIESFLLYLYIWTYLGRYYIEKEPDLLKRLIESFPRKEEFGEAVKEAEKHIARCRYQRDTRPVVPTKS